MSLASGRYWITPTQRAAMATSLGKQYRISGGKITKKPARMAAGQLKNAHGKAARQEAAWKGLKDRRARELRESGTTTTPVPKRRKGT